MRKFLRRIICKLLPEWRILTNPQYDFDKLKNQKNYEDDHRHIVVYAPYAHSEVEIGDCTYISKNSHISQTKIGKFCSIGPNLLCGWGIHPLNGISTSPMFYSIEKQNGYTLAKENKIDERAAITIGNDVFIGANVTILDGVTIGDGAVIGAGAIVSKDIPSYAIAVGCPIQIINYRFSELQRDALSQIKWWDFEKNELQEVERMFFNVDEFIEKYSRK